MQSYILSRPQIGNFYLASATPTVALCLAESIWYMMSFSLSQAHDRCNLFCHRLFNPKGTWLMSSVVWHRAVEPLRWEAQSSGHLASACSETKVAGGNLLGSSQLQRLWAMNCWLTVQPFTSRLGNQFKIFYQLKDTSLLPSAITKLNQWT